MGSSTRQNRVWVAWYTFSVTTQTKKYAIVFRRPTKRTFFESARKHIVKKGKAPRTLSRDIDAIVYAV